MDETLEQEAEAHEFAGPWTVTVVMADRAYGGPEEGGWWFDTFDPLDSEAMELAAEWQATRVFWDLKEAVAYSNALDERCEERNREERRRSKGSVLSRGVYEAYCFDGYPERIPGARPRYE